MFYLSKNHERDLKSAVLVAAVKYITDDTQLVRLRGKLSIKALEDLSLNVFLSRHFRFRIMEKSIFTMYIA